MTINKLLWAILGTVAVAVQGALTDGGMSAQDYVMTLGMVLAAVATWLVPNTPKLVAAKTWVSALVVGAGVLEIAMVGGVSQQEIWTIVIAVLTSAGVYVVPNKTQFALAA